MRIFAIALIMNFYGAQLFAQESELRATVTEEVVLEGLVSASGLEKKSGNYYIVSDDSPWLYILDDNYQIIRKYLLHENSYEGVLRIPSEMKPDYESIVEYKWGSKDLLIFGSGSGPNRKEMVRIDFTSRGYDVNRYTLEHLYNQIMEQGNIPPEKLNIEGAVSWRDHIVLMNRETNQLILIRKYAFERFMKYDPDKQANKKIDIDFYSFDLPVVGGVQARFSDGMKIKGENNMVFTASLERRNETATDGEILGSYVGVIPLKKITSGEYRIARVMKDGKPYTGKIEGVHVDDVEENKLKLNAVTDSDGGKSVFLRMELEL